MKLKPKIIENIHLITIFLVIGLTTFCIISNLKIFGGIAIVLLGFWGFWGYYFGIRSQNHSE